jgi:hypothetical protein
MNSNIYTLDCTSNIEDSFIIYMCMCIQPKKYRNMIYHYFSMVFYSIVLRVAI